ncbi:hypothetical protein HGK72_26865 [Mycolicibacterium fortuitum]|uniref:hypothetical protein n=1 Tax=Mycolicibacterium fortuitum TaxID=1766 RepID=UPI0014904E94|nr:hypothetical protein [Mycolicibacterium fortuitum]
MNPDLVLYRFFDADGALLYIGKSIRAWDRLAEHRRGARFYPDAANITLQRGFCSEAALAKAEVAAIQAERPRFNDQHNRRRPASTEPWNLHVGGRAYTQPPDMCDEHNCLGVCEPRAQAWCRNRDRAEEVHLQ